MTLLVVLVALSVVAMACQDTLAVSLVISEARNLGRFAGLFDALGDFASRYGAGIIAASVLRWGLGSWQTLVLVSATAATSFFTTNHVTGVASRLLPRARS